MQLAVRSHSTVDSTGTRRLLYYNFQNSSTGYSKVRNTSALWADYGTLLPQPAVLSTLLPQPPLLSTLLPTLNFNRSGSDTLVLSGAYDTRIRPWFNQAKAAPVAAFGINGSCWSEPLFTTVYVWSAPLISVVQAIYSNCTAETAVLDRRFVAVVSVDFDFAFLSTTLKETSPSVECEGSIVQEYGEVLAADDSHVAELDSDGGNRRLVVTNSALKQVQAMSLVIWSQLGSYPPEQGKTHTQVSVTPHTCWQLRSHNYPDGYHSAPTVT